MPGYLYYVPVPVVVEDPLTENQGRRLAADMRNTMKAVVLDDEISVVRIDDQEIQSPPPHHHVSTPQRVCPDCSENLAYDQQAVQIPE